jgi:hypothetical protein
MIDLVSSGRLATLAASLVTTLMIPTLIHPIPAHGSGGEAAAGAH